MEQINLNLHVDPNIMFIYNSNKALVNQLITDGISNYNSINTVVFYKVVKALIKIIETIPRMPGTEKKILLVNFIEYVIENELQTTDNNKELLNLAVNEILPDIIDIFVDLLNDIEVKVYFKRLIKKCC